MISSEEWVMIGEETVVQKQDSSSSEDDSDIETADHILSTDISKSFIILAKPIKQLLIKKIILACTYILWKNKISLLKYLNYKLYLLIVIITIIVFINNHLDFIL